MKINKNIVLERKGEKPILIDVFTTNKNTKQPVVIFCHGYKGFKDWGAWDLMAKKIANSGFCFIKFNFSHNGGTVSNPIDFPDLEAFGLNNYSLELNDLGDVMDWVENTFKEDPNIDTHKITLLGHSRGGGIAILKASEDSRVTNLITLASVSDFSQRFGTEEDLKCWKEKGVKYVVNGRTKQQMPHYYQFFEDFISNKERLNITSAIRKLNIPILIIHGNKDTSVSLQEGKYLHECNPQSNFKVIEGADHVFNTKHPWGKDELTRELMKVTDSIKTFLNKKA